MEKDEGSFQKRVRRIIVAIWIQAFTVSSPIYICYKFGENTACLVIVKFGMSQFTLAWRNAVWELFMCKFTVKTPDFSDSEVPKWGPGPLGFGLKNFADAQLLHAIVHKQVQTTAVVHDNYSNTVELSGTKLGMLPPDIKIIELYVMTKSDFLFSIACLRTSNRNVQEQDLPAKSYARPTGTLPGAKYLLI